MIRKRGRPRKQEQVKVPWNKIEESLVNGIGIKTFYPSYRDLANKYKVSHSLIAQFAKTHKCMERRKEMFMFILYDDDF